MHTFLVLYSIILHSNDEERTVPLDQLEGLNGLTLSKKDATIDADVIWMYRGKTPYKSTIVGIHTDKDKGRHIHATQPLHSIILL